MASIRKRGSRWFAQVRREGFSKSRTFARKLDAQVWAAEMERAIERGDPLTSGRQCFRDVLQRYAVEVSPTKRGARWEAIRLDALSRDELADYQIDRITPDLLGQWRDRRLAHVKAGSVLRDITLLTAVFEHARREWRLIASNPMRDVRKPATPKHRERLPTDDEIDRITLALGYDDGDPITTASQQIAVAWLLAIETAMRAGELLSLEWDQVDTQRRVARLDKTKNGDSRDVPLSGRACDLFDALRPVNPMRCFTVRAGTRDVLFRRARDASGIIGLTFHDSRALALTRLSKKLDVLQLARVAGHRDVRSLSIYYRESAEDIAKLL